VFENSRVQLMADSQCEAQSRSTTIHLRKVILLLIASILPLYIINSGTTIHLRKVILLLIASILHLYIINSGTTILCRGVEWMLLEVE
jgi:hypothetical protein